MLEKLEELFSIEEKRQNGLTDFEVVLPKETQTGLVLSVTTWKDSGTELLGAIIKIKVDDPETGIFGYVEKPIGNISRNHNPEEVVLKDEEV
jgi:hypothetical protein